MAIDDTGFAAAKPLGAAAKAAILLRNGYTLDDVAKIDIDHTIAQIQERAAIAPAVVLPVVAPPPQPKYPLEVIQNEAEAAQWIRHRDFRNPRLSVIYFVGDLGRLRIHASVRIAELQRLQDQARPSKPRPPIETVEIETLQTALDLTAYIYKQATVHHTCMLTRKPWREGLFLNIATRRPR